MSHTKRTTIGVTYDPEPEPSIQIDPNDSRLHAIAAVVRALGGDVAVYVVLGERRFRIRGVL